jgi:hypothetical protein
LSNNKSGQFMSPDNNIPLPGRGTFGSPARYIGMPQHEQQERAERLFKAREQQKADAPQAMAEYHAAIQRTRERTEELRRLRLAREAREARKQARSG